MAAPSASPTGSTAAPRTVARLSSEFWWLLKEVARGFGRDHVSMLAKQTAYSLLFALPSLMVMLVAMAAIVDKRTEAGLSEALNRAIDERAPDVLQPLLEHLVQHAITEMSESSAGVAALISLLIAVWGVAGAVGTLVFACNLVYGIVDRRSYVARKLLTLVLTVVGGGLVVTAFVLFTFGRLIGDWVEETTDRQGILVELAANAGGWSIALVACSLAGLYAMAPDAKTSFRWILPGVGVTTLVIYLEFVGFEFLLAARRSGERLRLGRQRPDPALVPLPDERDRHRRRGDQCPVGVAPRPQAGGVPRAPP